MPPAEAAAPGRLITFEGGEGAGKTTQLARLAGWLEGLGLDVVCTREPGGTPGAEEIRHLLVEGAASRWLPSTELLLVAAARDDHLQRLILPALADGAWVLCDRYIHSTLVYQSIAGGVDPGEIALLHEHILKAPLPDLTIVLDLPPSEGLRRRALAGQGGRFEAKGDDFHEWVRLGFRKLSEAGAAAKPSCTVIIDATPSPEQVAEVVRGVVARQFGFQTA